jgi:nucleoside-diphosphate-sugar epimerase
MNSSAGSPPAPRFLVTGGTGFIGRRLLERLITDYGAASIVCLVLPPASPLEQAALDRLRARGVCLISGDLNDPAVSTCAAPPVDIVLHLAANIDTAAREPALRVNDLGTTRLLDWLRPVSAGARIVYTSSVAVQDRAAPAREALTESSPCTPRTLYGSTKLRGEQILRERAASDGFTYTLVRLATIYGPGAKPGGLFESLFRLASEESWLARLDWPGRVSIMHVDDVAALLAAIGQRADTRNEIYCAANPYAPSVGELARHIGRLSGHPIRPLPAPPIAWAAVRSLMWNPVIRAAGSTVAAQSFWRFTLLVDHAFWFDTTKMQGIWTQPPIDLDAGLLQMLTSLQQPTGSGRDPEPR